MTQRDYVKFAALIAGEDALIDEWPIGNKRDLLRNLRLSIADIFAADNHRFDRARFYQACEPKPIKHK